jgi:predicted flap endonuclease-1-like 5' DNA nuclease
MAKKQAPTVQSSSHSSSQLSSPLTAADDFKLISSMSPTLERRLHNAGVRTYAQLASMSPSSLSQLLTGSGVSASKINQQNWIDKARELAGLPDADAPNTPNAPVEEAELVYRQHYAVYTVRLLLNESNEVRYTEVKHVESEDKQTWAGWDEQSLVKFFAEHANLKLPPAHGVISDKAHGAAALEIQERMPLAITVSEVMLDEVKAQPSNGKVFFGQRLCAHITFDLTGDNTQAVTATESAFIVQALAREQVTGQTHVLGTADGHLCADTLMYSTTVEFDLPSVGRYQVLGTVLLPRELASGVRQGAAFKVVP